MRAKSRLLYWLSRKVFLLIHYLYSKINNTSFCTRSVYFKMVFYVVNTIYQILSYSNSKLDLCIGIVKINQKKSLNDCVTVCDDDDCSWWWCVYVRILQSLRTLHVLSLFVISVLYLCICVFVSSSLQVLLYCCSVLEYSYPFG